jgi:hypothetical protein
MERHPSFHAGAPAQGAAVEWASRRVRESPSANPQVTQRRQWEAALARERAQSSGPGISLDPAAARIKAGVASLVRPWAKPEWVISSIVGGPGRDTTAVAVAAASRQCERNGSEHPESSCSRVLRSST